MTNSLRVAAGWALGMALAAPAPAPAGDGNKPADGLAHLIHAAEEAGARISGQELAAAWNKNDVKAMAALFTEDADLISPFGRMARGTGEIERLFRQEPGGPMKGSTFFIQKHDVRFLTQDVAVANLDIDLTGIRGADGKPVLSTPQHMTNILVRVGPKWLIAVSRPMSYTPAPAGTAAPEK